MVSLYRNFRDSPIGICARASAEQPEGKGGLGALIDHLLVARGEGVGLVAVHVDCPDYRGSARHEDGDDYFRSGVAERREVARVGAHVAYDYGLLLLDGGSGQTLVCGKGRMFGSVGTGPGDDRH